VRRLLKLKVSFAFMGMSALDVYHAAFTSHYFIAERNQEMAKVASMGAYNTYSILFRDVSLLIGLI
jgi:hypothetical protein